MFKEDWFLFQPQLILLYFSDLRFTSLHAESEEDTLIPFPSSTPPNSLSLKPPEKRRQSIMEKLSFRSSKKDKTLDIKKDKTPKLAKKSSLGQDDKTPVRSGRRTTSFILRGKKAENSRVGVTREASTVSRESASSGGYGTSLS